MESENHRQVVERKSIKKFIQQIPQNISSTVEHFFYSLGLLIAKSPIKWIIGSIIVVLLCLSGFYNFRQEKNPLKLWVPPDSPFLKDTEWLMTQFKDGQRVEEFIMTADDDIFQPEILYQLNELTKRIMLIETNETKITWTDVCFKIPIISGINSIQRNKRNIDDDFFDEEPAVRMNTSNLDIGVYAPSDIYCKILNSLPKGCFLFSILDLWEYNSSLILQQTRNDIINKINTIDISPTLGHKMNFKQLIGGSLFDEKGNIISGKAIKTQWMVYVDLTKINMNQVGNDVGTSDWATLDVLNWESSFLNELHLLSNKLKKFNQVNDNKNRVEIWYEAGRSFGDISSSTMFQDIKKVIAGVILMTFYVQLVLSRFNWLEWRFCLTSAGLLCVGGAFIVAVGVCSIFGVPYGPVHSSLPFMLMGLGVDDIFVMMASWDEVMSNEINRVKSVNERIGLMLSHAGAAICITSLTDVVAFIIGASTILPSLESFCIYATVGVLVTFLLQVTFFVAIFTLDVKRVENNRNGIFPCIKHHNYVLDRNDPSKSISWRLIQWLYSNIVLTIPGKVTIIFITLTITSIAGFGAYHLEQWFDPNWFLPKHSYLSNYKRIHNEQFPNRGHPAAVYIGDINYPAEYTKLINVTERLIDMSQIDHVESWPHEFSQFIKHNYNLNIIDGSLSNDEFNLYLSKFLFSQKGGKFQKNFRFNGNLTCGEMTPKILLSSISFSFISFNGPHEWITAMDNVQLLIKEMEFSKYATVWSKIFASWVTDKVIAREVTRNIILALICVMATTTVLIAEPQTCIWILICVSLTLVDVCGFMYYWDLSIDIVSCIALELAVGLSVDYAAHVAHAFLIAPNNPNNIDDNHSDKMERTLIAVRHIGAAVVFGAGSTLLSQFLLAFSEAYVFRTFFKIFLMVILFGIWHGLFLLPVILSTFGPKSLHKIDNNVNPIDKKNIRNINKEDNNEIEIPLNTIES